MVHDYYYECIPIVIDPVVRYIARGLSAQLIKIHEKLTHHKEATDM